MTNTQLSSSFVSKGIALETTCDCIMCNTKLRVAIETKAFVLEDEVVSYEVPTGLLCLTCKSPYLRWNKAHLIPKKRL